MIKPLLFFFVFCCMLQNTCGQVSTYKILYVIDSIPLLNDPQEWSPILQEDIADISALRNKDTLKLLGWEYLDGVTYIFTKEYRNRPDSLKKIPSLKQMEMKDGAWNFHGIPYSGRYIDYYNSGKKQNEGTLLNGKLNGELIIFFKNGNKKSVAHYIDGIEHGIKNEYYKNGALMQTRNFIAGKQDRTGKIYFINGQIQHELKLKQSTPYDTSLTYHSTGQIKQLKLMKNRVAISTKQEQNLNYYTTHFNHSLNSGDLKKANNWFFKLWKIDSTSTDSYFKGGLLFIKEFRFEQAIAEFDKALKMEPLMREALLYRGLARFYQFSKDGKNSSLSIENIHSIPSAEQVKICADLQQADFIDYSDMYVKKKVPQLILDYCSNKSRPIHP